MVASAVQVFIPLTLVLVILLSAGILWASRVKKNLGEHAPAAHVGATSEPLQLNSECAKHIRALSAEPFLLKQAADGLRVQIANRPIVPVALFTDNGVAAALMLAAVKANDQFGQDWMALVSLGNDDTVSLRRLA
jgi:hypothetical protein